MLRKVISGGQTGADQAGWKAAKSCGLETGGWMPLGFETEVGLRPVFSDLYGAVEHPSGDYPSRTKANVRDSDATLILTGSIVGPGTQLTISEANRIGRPCLHVAKGKPDAARLIADWIARYRVETLNVAGNRESTTLGIGLWAETLLVEAFGLVAE
jgi:hypothetical protein